MKKYFIFFISLYFIFAPVCFANTTTGFIPGQIWYSKDNIIEGDNVKIYTAIWNNNTSSLSARVEFYDQNVILGTRDVVVSPLQLEGVSVSWKVTAGDHLISAKILSPSITNGGKKEYISLVNSSTVSDHKYIPVVLTTVDGQPATTTDVFKSQIDKATSSLDDIVPSSISDPISKNTVAIDNFRTDTLKNILETKASTEKKIEDLNKQDVVSKTISPVGKIAASKVVTPQRKSIDNATEKPIAYIKLFFFKILAFIFGNKIVFYLLIVLVAFFIGRGIYRKIKNR